MKYLKYFKYVIIHKWWVFYYCCKDGLYWQGLVHDWSKFLPDEFIPYAEYFYGGYERGQQPQPVKDAFDVAWLKHIHRNPHHWQYWILHYDNGSTKVLVMPDRYRREMVADWNGAGRAITGKADTKEWFLKNMIHIDMNLQTFVWVCDRLGIE